MGLVDQLNARARRDKNSAEFVVQDSFNEYEETLRWIHFYESLAILYKKRKTNLGEIIRSDSF